MNSFLKKTLIFVVVMGLVAVSGWFGRKAYKKATEHRLVSEAGHYLQTRDFTNASLCLRRALQINPVSVTASKLTADMLDAIGAPAALGWRIRTFQLQTNNLDYRFAWAETALKDQDMRSAAQALSGVDEKARSTATFQKLAGAFAWGLKDQVDAEKHYAEALRLDPTNQTTLLNLATVRLASTNQAVADSARLSLEQFPASSPLHLLALRDLAKDAEARKSFDQAVRFSQAIVSDPAATYSDKIAHLQILRDAGAPGYKAWLSDLEAEAKHSVDHAYALGRWMLVADSPSNSLRWLQSLPPALQTNQPIPLILTDCEISLKDWKGLMTTIGKRDWGEAECYRLALESLAERNLDESSPAKSAWQKALRLASHRLDRFTRLAQITASWGWKPELNEVLQQVVDEFPKEKWAFDDLMSSLYASGSTQALAELLSRKYSADPADNRLKNNLAAISLLRKSDLEHAHRMAREAYDSSPDNPFFISTYAYSLLLQSKPEEAAKIAGTLKAEYLKNPSIAAYYGTVQAQSGHKDVAKEPLKLAETAKLLPEEMEMVRRAKNLL